MLTNFAGKLIKCEEKRIWDIKRQAQKLLPDTYCQHFSSPVPFRCTGTGYYKCTSVVRLFT